MSGRASPSRRCARRRAAGRALRPHPVLRLALPVLRLRRLRRAPRRAGPTARVDGVPRGARTPSSSCAPTRSTRAFAGRTGRRSRRVYLGGGTPSLLPAEAVAGLLDARPRRASGWRAGAEVTLEANPGPDERGDAAALRRGRRHPAVARRPVDGRRRARAGSAGAIGRPTSATPSPRRARPGSRSVSLDLLYDVPGRLARRLDRRRSTRRSPRARPPLALRADARRPRRRGLDRPRRRPPADDRRRPPLARGARPAPGRGSGRRPVPPRRPSPGRATAGAATRSATGRGPATRAGTTSSTGSGGRTRRSGPGAHAFDGATRRWNAARLDGYLARAARRPDGRAPSLPPGGVGGDRRRRPRPRSASSSALRHGPRRPARGRARAAARRTASAGRSTAELVDVTPDDRVVLTTRGRLLSNELFARLV